MILLPPGADAKRLRPLRFWSLFGAINAVIGGRWGGADLVHGRHPGRQDDRLPRGHDRLKKLFIPFYTTKQKGTGLGLHLSQKLANLLGGQIHFQSEHGKGSAFTLVLRDS